jgi:hypothetical protein
MCYNARVSAGTFLFVAAVTAYLWSRNRGIDRPLGLMLLVVAVMQLLEWGLWLSVPGCNWLNKLITAIIPIYLVLQPVALNWIVGSYDAGWGTGYKTVAAVAAATMLPYQLYRAADSYGDCSYVEARSGHLVWKGLPLKRAISLVYYPTLIYPFLTLKNSPFAILYLFFAALSHGIFKSQESKSWPSLWCHFANTLAAFAVVRPSP